MVWSDCTHCIRDDYLRICKGKSLEYGIRDIIPEFGGAEEQIGSRARGDDGLGGVTAGTEDIGFEYPIGEGEVFNAPDIVGLAHAGVVERQQEITVGGGDVQPETAPGTDAHAGRLVGISLD